MLSSSTLAVNCITLEDEAIYQCIAENSAGTNQASARLAVAQVKDLPATPQGLGAHTLSNSALRVTWRQPPAEVTDAIIGYVLQIRKIGGKSNQSNQESGWPVQVAHTFHHPIALKQYVVYM